MAGVQRQASSEDIALHDNLCSVVCIPPPCLPVLCESLPMLTDSAARAGATVYSVPT